MPPMFSHFVISPSLIQPVQDVHTPVGSPVHSISSNLSSPSPTHYTMKQQPRMPTSPAPAARSLFQAPAISQLTENPLFVGDDVLPASDRQMPSRGLEEILRDLMQETASPGSHTHISGPEGEVVNLTAQLLHSPTTERATELLQTVRKTAHKAKTQLRQKNEEVNKLQKDVYEARTELAKEQELRHNLQLRLMGAHSTIQKLKGNGGIQKIDAYTKTLSKLKDCIQTAEKELNEKRLRLCEAEHHDSVRRQLKLRSPDSSLGSSPLDLDREYLDNEALLSPKELPHSTLPAAEGNGREAELQRASRSLLQSFLAAARASIDAGTGVSGPPQQRNSISNNVAASPMSTSSNGHSPAGSPATFHQQAPNAGPLSLIIEQMLFNPSPARAMPSSSQFASPADSTGDDARASDHEDDVSQGSEPAYHVVHQLWASSSSAQEHQPPSDVSQANEYSFPPGSPRTLHCSSAAAATTHTLLSGSSIISLRQQYSGSVPSTSPESITGSRPLNPVAFLDVVESWAQYSHALLLRGSPLTAGSCPAPPCSPLLGYAPAAQNLAQGTMQSQGCQTVVMETACAIVQTMETSTVAGTDGSCQTSLAGPLVSVGVQAWSSSDAGQLPAVFDAKACQTQVPCMVHASTQTSHTPHCEYGVQTSPSFSHQRDMACQACVTSPRMDTCTQPDVRSSSSSIGTPQSRSMLRQSAGFKPACFTYSRDPVPSSTRSRDDLVSSPGMSPGPAAPGTLPLALASASTIAGGITAGAAAAPALAASTAAQSVTPNSKPAPVAPAGAASLVGAVAALLASPPDPQHPVSYGSSSAEHDDAYVSYEEATAEDDGATIWQEVASELSNDAKQEQAALSPSYPTPAKPRKHHPPEATVDHPPEPKVDSPALVAEASVASRVTAAVGLAGAQQPSHSSETEQSMGSSSQRISVSGMTQFSASSKRSSIVVPTFKRFAAPGTASPTSFTQRTSEPGARLGDMGQLCSVQASDLSPEDLAEIQQASAAPLGRSSGGGRLEVTSRKGSGHGRDSILSMHMERISSKIPGAQWLKARRSRSGSRDTSGGAVQDQQQRRVTNDVAADAGLDTGAVGMVPGGAWAPTESEEAHQGRSAKGRASFKSLSIFGKLKNRTQL